MEAELASLHISQPKEEREPSLNSNSNPNMIRIRRKSSNISRTNSNTMFPPVPPSPTISEHSLIFERSVEDLTTLPSSSGNTLGSMTNLTMLTKQRSNSNVLLQRQLTGGSVNSVTSNLMTPMMLPVSATVSNSSNNNCARNSISLQSPNSSHTTNHHHHHRRRTIENLVAPALDASCSLIADQNTQMDNVNVIHSRNSSIIGLNMALGLSRSSSINNTLNKKNIMNGTSTTTTTTGQSDLEDDQNNDSECDSDTDRSDTDEQNNASSINRNNKNANNAYFSMRRSSSSRRSSRSNTTSTQTSPRFSANNDPGKVLKFYSYVDMVSDEHINPAISNRRPSFLSGSVSSPLLTPSELLNSSVSNHSMSPPSQSQTPSAGSNFLKSPLLSANKRDPQQQPYLSPPLSSRRLSGNNSNIANSMPRSPTYNAGSGMIATSPPSFQKGNRRTMKSKKNENNALHNNDIKFQIDSSDEFSSDDDNDGTELFNLEQTETNKNKIGGNAFINSQNLRQNNATTSTLKTSMFQTGNNNSNPDLFLKNKSRTYSNASCYPPHQTSRSGSTSGTSFRKLSIPTNNTNNNTPMVAINSASPVLPSPYSLQMENLGAVLRQKVSDSQPISKSSTETSKET